MGMTPPALPLLNNVEKNLKIWKRGTSRTALSIILTVTAVMTWGTQLVEGEHLTGGDMRFCRESSKSGGFYDRGSENTINCRK